jgi:hypothetical protein
MLDDVLSFRKTNTDSNVDITTVVANHISIGDKVDDSLRVLSENSFTYRINETLMEMKPQYDVIYSAGHDTRKWYNFGFGDVIEIYLFVKSNVVEKIYAKIVYRSL